MYLTVLILCFSATYADDLESWTGKWFPLNPEQENEITEKYESHNVPMGIANNDCDNGKDGLEVDFDPTNPADLIEYECWERRSAYKPNVTVNPILIEQAIPPFYVPLHKCMNETIKYAERLPSYGSHRPLWAKYGEYSYLPIQRWQHNLEHGAVVMLYHPCANYEQVEKLKLVVKNCLYRHVITPSKRLLPERPLALVAWGRTLEMSFVDLKIVIAFIKENALKGPEKTFADGQYDLMMDKEAKLVSDESDSILCPNYS